MGAKHFWSYYSTHNSKIQTGVQFLARAPPWKILGRIQILLFAEELVPSLKHEIPANLVAWQLAPLLLSRMVLLDKAAVEHFLPHMLTPKGQTQLKHNNGVKNFTIPSCTNFKNHIFWEGHRFCEIFTLLLSTVHTDKSKVKISQKFVAFSEYMNITCSNSNLNLRIYEVIFYWKS